MPQCDYCHRTGANQKLNGNNWCGCSSAQCSSCNREVEINLIRIHNFKKTCINCLYPSGIIGKENHEIDSYAKIIGYDFIFFPFFIIDNVEINYISNYLKQKYNFNESEIKTFFENINYDYLLEKSEYNDLNKFDEQITDLIKLFFKRYGLIGYSNKNLIYLNQLLNRKGKNINPIILYRILIFTTIKCDHKKVRDFCLKTPNSHNIDPLKLWIESHSLNNSLDIRKIVHYQIKENNYRKFIIPLIDDTLKMAENIQLDIFEKNLTSNPSNFEYYKIEDIDMMNGYDFEDFLCLLFQEMGYSSRKTPRSNDQGCDIILERKNERIIVKAKIYSSKVGNSAIQEIFSAISYYSANKGIVVTNNYFSPSARELAKFNQIDLIDRSKLEGFLTFFPCKKPICSPVKSWYYDYDSS